uniref:Protein kintoun n=1 Tax=Electrophorus electricus TaxID=8005 RepID=A0A4W4EPQ1_ELEEL
MDFGNKLELQLTTDEINRFSKALKDEKFREMLHEYAEEISNPENRKKYEEEITQLEQERGNNVQFIHPKPHHVLKTSIDGKEKCFINICSNEMINKPTCNAGRSEDGRVGQQWSLPYSLSPGRPDRDVKGNKCMIYDVVFHPETLYIAVKNARFMKLVNSTATQGIEDAFKVKLDRMNVKVLKGQYKGVPHPAVIRKPLPRHPGKEKAAPDEFFSSFYHDKSDIVPNKNPIPLPITPTQGGQGPVRHRFSLPEQPTKPNYTIKYRSVVDLQDYRCSRDSAPSPRPKEIVITIDLPLLKSAGDADLNVSERNLVLQSQKPAYRLELQLSYPVDGDKGDAKFNKAKKQLIITLPVLPTKDPVVIHAKANQPVSNDEEKDERECDKGEMVVNESGELALTIDEESKTKLSDVSQLEIPNGPTNSSQHLIRKSVMDLSVVYEEPSKIISTLDEDSKSTVSLPEEIGMLPEEHAMNSSPEHPSPTIEHKNNENASLVEEIEVPLMEQVNNLFLEKKQIDSNINTPAILQETNPEDGSEVNISDHVTSSVLSFQNSLWFELD